MAEVPLASQARQPCRLLRKLANRFRLLRKLANRFRLLRKLARNPNGGRESGRERGFDGNSINFGSATRLRSTRPIPSVSVSVSVSQP